MNHALTRTPSEIGSVYQDVPDRGYVIIAAAVPLLSLTTLVVALRLYSKGFLTKSLSWDDWTTVAAWVFVCALGATEMAHNNYGQGKPFKTLDPGTVVKFFKVLYGTIVTYYATLFVVKTAILLQYYRIFAAGKMRHVTMAVMVVVGLISLAMLLVTVKVCHPIEAFWNRRLTASCNDAKCVQAKCFPTRQLWRYTAAVNIFTDLVILCLPIRVLWRLHLPLSQRLSLIGVFALGFFTCIISAIRITNLDHPIDITYDNVTPAAWSLAEVSCAVTTSCLPTLRPLLSRFFPTVFGNRHGSGASRSGGRRRKNRLPGSWNGSAAGRSSFSWSLRSPTFATKSGGGVHDRGDKGQGWWMELLHAGGFATGIVVSNVEFGSEVAALSSRPPTMGAGAMDEEEGRARGSSSQATKSIDASSAADSIIGLRSATAEMAVLGSNDEKPSDKLTTGMESHYRITSDQRI